jgi:ATP-binding protein involved in chromosome partitioning
MPMVAAPPDRPVPDSAQAPQLEDAVGRALSRVIDPEIRKPITELDMVGGVEVDSDGVARIHLKLTIVGCPAADTIARDVRAAASGVEGVTAVEVDVSIMSSDERRALVDKLRGPGAHRSVQFGEDSLTSIYAVTSGKGGVGKSTVTANLAVALAARGLRVGIVDADVYGFSIPSILGLVDSEGLAVKPTRVGDMILPPVGRDVKVISIGMFIDSAPGSGTSGGAVAWRGPMLHRTIQQFLTDVFFGDLDVLLLDLPPGTGDIAISIGQLLPRAEVIVVTTPQPAAADVAERSGIVARQTGQQIFGVIENMGPLTQADGSVLDLFGSGGGAEVAKRLSRGQATPVPLLASVPLSLELRRGGDAGNPLVLADPSDPASVAILSVADRIATRGRGLSGRRLGVSPR